MKFQLLVAFFAIPFLAGALEVKDVKVITVVGESKGQTKVKKVYVGKMKSDTHFTQVDPHLFMNPDKKTAKWSGFQLRKAIKEFLSPKTNRTVVASGADAYSAEYTESVVLESPVMVALEKDGAKLLPKEGGPQIAFPLDDKKLPEQYKTEPFWVWYLSAIFVGDLPPTVAVEDAGGKRDVRLEKFPGAKTTNRVVCVPAGRRTTKEMRGAVDLTYVPLSDFVKIPAGATPKIVVGTYLETQTEIPLADASQYYLAFATNQEKIAPLWGGPVKLVHATKPGQCIYFVSDVRLKL